MPGAFGCAKGSSVSSAGSVPTSPSTDSNMERVTKPGRKIMGVSLVISTIVDSKPSTESPPSKIMSMRPAISSITKRALVGLGRPERFALGAAIKPPAARINAAAPVCEGKRTATVESPPVVSVGTRSFFSKIIVSGPGQKASARRLALSGTCAASSSNDAMSAIWTISGLSDGLPFAA